jgi:uncharacterized protein (TIGR03067 family)
MRGYTRLVAGLALVLVGAALVAAADSAKDEAIKKDRAQYEGTWRIVSLEINGKKATAEDTKKVTVVNQADTWIVQVDGKEVARGTSTIDPTKKPKTIDFTPTKGSNEGKLFHGIYAIDGDSRKLCFAQQPGKDRPTEFASKQGREHVLVTFERVKK